MRSSGEKLTQSCQRREAFLSERSNTISHCRRGTAIVRHSTPWMRNLVTVALHMGLRETELLTLRWSQIDLLHKHIQVNESKNNTEESIPLTKTAYHTLKSIPHTGSLVFGTHYHQPQRRVIGL